MSSEENIFHEMVVRKKVFEPLLRVLHWSIALLTSGLILTGFYFGYAEPGAEKSTLLNLHIVMGYLLLISLIIRFIWGFCGSRTSRWKDLISPSEWGHYPKVGFLYLGLYCLFIFSVFSGFALAGIEHGLGPVGPWLFDELKLSPVFLVIHQTVYYFILFFIPAHLIGMIIHEKRTGLPVTQEMISGFQYKFKQRKEGLNE
jgi:cytochrome b561